MARILAISSQVVRGHVGLSAVVPALQALGHEAWPVPTIVLSNQPGHTHVSGVRIAPDILSGMLDALGKNGWLGEVDAVLTGYLPSAGHVRVAADAVRRLRNERSVPFLCDPVLGDHAEGLYLDADAAAAIRAELMPLADIATPNLFELNWLTSHAAHDLPSTIAAARALACPTVVVTSANDKAGRLHNLCVEGKDVHACDVRHRPAAPHGTGDLLSALLLGFMLSGDTVAIALARAAAGIDIVLDRSEGRDELALAPALPALRTTPPITVTRIA